MNDKQELDMCLDHLQMDLTSSANSSDSEVGIPSLVNTDEPAIDISLPSTDGEAPVTDANGRCVKTGRFLPGKAKAGPGRPKGSRNSMTKRMLNRVAERSEAGLSMEEIMMDIAQSSGMPPELRFKAAKAVADLVYPKAASVEVKVDDAENMSIQQIDDKLKALLALSSS